MTLSLDELRRLRDKLAENHTLDAPHPLSIPTHFPSADEITVLTFNLFDNGPNVKETWFGARLVMNFQAFTQTEPFTPSKDLAAWAGSIQLHTTTFVGRYLTARFPAEEERLRPMLIEADKLADRDDVSDVRLGQLYSKTGGTRYVWGTMLRTHVDGSGEFVAELLHEGRSFRDQGFTPVNDPKRPTLKMVARHDPHGLWKTSRKFPRKSKGSRP